ncbi:MAG: transcriptional repressor NrdR [Alphaproteobacteria bacterium]|nr:transcriptional repressor NrdR [Alphaproteobacteria bacterium]
MRCPFCSCPDTQVKDSRVSEDGYSIRRRRSCPKCGSRFTTLEHIQMRDLIVVKKNDVRVPFEREKLYKSILLAVSKRDIDADKVDQIVNRIVRQLESGSDSEIRSSTIGELVMDELLALDKVAYVRYASVYKNFTNPKDFEDFTAKLARKK